MAQKQISLSPTWRPGRGDCPLSTSTWQAFHCAKPTRLRVVRTSCLDQSGNSPTLGLDILPHVCR
eukprot:12937426-Prorocentrum_lima.AAC.1